MRQDDVHPAVGTAAGTATASQIAPLKELKDYKVAKEDPDVRGWNVIGRDGRTVGEVHDLLVDTGAMRVRYLDVELDHGLLASAPTVPGTAGVVGAYAAPGMAGAGPVVDQGNEGHGHHVLVPIGSARLDEDHDRVYLEGMESHDAALLPAYDHRAFSREYETGVRRRFDRDYNPAAADRDFYAGDLFNDERFYEPRRKRRGLFR
ncbi:MAG TPA: PRC-barrel domain-containing protein [Thermoanaerobaculia bacterium]|jgi:sporulation protein YlmC with PRC-barrel domain|nr:PRC-barrel domain-containing protein [Thermoanaerobaculia bacterium]